MGRRIGCGESAMMSEQRVSQAGLALLKTFEGVRPEPRPWPDAPGVGDGADAARWLVGLSHEVRGPRPEPLSDDALETRLRSDLAPFEAVVARAVAAPLTQNQFDALVSLAANIGAGAFTRSRVVARLNEGLPLEAADAFEDWRFARFGERLAPIDALVRRRAAEKALFLTPETPILAAATPWMRPVAGPEALTDRTLHGVFDGDSPPLDRADVGAQRPFAPDEDGAGEASGERPGMSPLGSGTARDGARPDNGGAALIPPAVAARRRILAQPPARAWWTARRRAEIVRWCILTAGVGAVLAVGGAYQGAQVAALEGSQGAWPAVSAIGVLVGLAAAYFAWRPEGLMGDGEPEDAPST